MMGQVLTGLRNVLAPWIQMLPEGDPPMLNQSITWMPRIDSCPVKFATSKPSDVARLKSSALPMFSTIFEPRKVRVPLPDTRSSLFPDELLASLYEFSTYNWPPLVHTKLMAFPPPSVLI